MKEERARSKNNSNQTQSYFNECKYPDRLWTSDPAAHRRLMMQSSWRRGCRSSHDGRWWRRRRCLRARRTWRRMKWRHSVRRVVVRRDAGPVAWSVDGRYHSESNTRSTRWIHEIITKETNTHTIYLVRSLEAITTQDGSAGNLQLTNYSSKSVKKERKKKRERKKQRSKT